MIKISRIRLEKNYLVSKISEMKYLLLGIWYIILFLLFLIAITVQFLWNFKEPTVTLKKTIERGMEFLENWGNDDDYGY